MSVHNCPNCKCLTDKQIRERMRYEGHTCIWSSEYLFNLKAGYLDYDCKICERNKLNARKNS